MGIKSAFSLMGIRKKHLGVLGLTILLLGSIALFIGYIRWAYPPSPFPTNSAPGEFPITSTGLGVKEDVVYDNGTIRFTVYCDYKRDGEKLYPEEDLFHVEKVFVCTEDDLLSFEPSLGDLRDPNNVTILTGDLTLKAWQELTVFFHTDFHLETGSQVYVGVIATYLLGTVFPEDKVTRWDRYTTVLPALDH